MYRTIRFIDDLIDFIIRIVFIMIMLLGAYYTYDSWYIYHNAADSSYLRFKPESPEDLPKLGELSEDLVGWITIDNTNIDYPIMQGATNDKYLNIDPYGKFSLSGSIFLDSRNKPDFSDPYSLIYGHHMDHGYMFGGLDSFLKEDYFKKHTKGTLYSVDGTIYKFHLFSATETRTDNDSVYAVSENEGPAKFLETKADIFIRPKSKNWDKRILGLSTCKTPDSIERVCVFGYLEKAEQTAVDFDSLQEEAAGIKQDEADR